MAVVVALKKYTCFLFNILTENYDMFDIIARRQFTLMHFKMNKKNIFFDMNTKGNSI